MLSAAELSSEQLKEKLDFGAGWSSLSDILTHLINANKYWRIEISHIVGMPLPQSDEEETYFGPESFAVVTALQQEFMTENKKTRKLLDGVSTEMLNRQGQADECTGQLITPALWQIMMHLLNHGTQHRSEAACILTHFNHSPGDMDMLEFFEKQCGPTWPDNL